MHALLPRAAGPCLAPPQLRSQRSSNNSRLTLPSGDLNGAFQAPWSSSSCIGSSNSSSSSSRLRSSSQSQADGADQYPELPQLSAINSTVEALLTAESEAEAEQEYPEVAALVAAAAGKAQQQQAADGSQEENPYSPEDALSGAPTSSTRSHGVQPASPELEALLQAAAASGDADYAVSLEQLQALFPFQLDGFQEKAVQQLLEGRSVVVCAPTGAGKTAIAEAAAAAALARGQRVIYTTP
ncbi:hypothetical protein COO60DRAFT_136093 [Scenedesmus sp. NREL 46B-D3]|nr:hypothetical protein COO60DRAFT_136093 [Scenedesmus sp. NREL 46B-D3]